MLTRVLLIGEVLESVGPLFDLLTDAGYEVVVYPAMLQDFTDVELISPDLILVDCPAGEHEPDQQLLQRLATEASAAAIPLILCVARSSQCTAFGTMPGARDGGVVVKPFRDDELLQVVYQTLSSTGDVPLPGP